MTSLSTRRILAAIFLWSLAAIPVEAVTNYRSIGTRGAYGTAGPEGNFTQVSATLNSPVVFGLGGTQWRTFNRGMGDQIAINAVNYTILSVDSETQITLTSNFAQSTNSYNYSITRKYNSIPNWYTGISGNLVTGTRKEIGIVYNDSVITLSGVLQFSSSTTSSQYDITLTVADRNRHYGIPGNGVVVDLANNSIRPYNDQYVTIEWLELINSTGRAFHLSGPKTAPAKTVIRNCLIHNVDSPFRWFAVHNADIFNNVVYGASNGIEMTGFASTVRIFNNTIYNSSGNAIVADAGTVTLNNNIAHTCSSPCFSVPAGVRTATSSNNLSSDATATSVNPGGDNVNWNNVLIGAMNFQNYSAGDLHILSGSRAIDQGVNINTLYSPLFSTDIDNGARTGTWDIGADEYGIATAVNLVSFNARRLDRSVELTWQTASELNNLGFHLYRAAMPEGPFERITETAIPGLGSSPSGARYRHVDTDVVNGETYFYKLEDIESTGRTKLHGPVSATPAAGEGVVTTRDPSSPSGIVVGNPDATSFRIVERGSGYLLVELRAGGFTAQPRDDGSVRVEIPGLLNESAPGTPDLPVWRSWIDAVAGRGARVLAVQEAEVETFSSLRPAAAGSPELVSSRLGAVRAGERRARPGRLFSGAGLYPEAAARLAGEGYQGAAKKVLLEISPVRWNRGRKELVLARRVRVRIAFSGQETNRRESPSAGRATAVRRLFTEAPGLYGVRFEDVWSARSAGVDVSSLSLARGGIPVAYHVEPNPDWFGPGSTLYFVSGGASINPYGREAAYELARLPGVTMAVVPGSPGGATVPYFVKTLSREENRYYQAGLLDVRDLWFWDLLFAPATKRYTFDVDRLAPVATPGSVDVWLQGVSDVEGSSDHHVRLYVNGVYLTKAAWDGKLPSKLSAEIAPGLLRDGTNELALENVGDTGTAYSMVMLDRYSVSYPRRVAATNGTIEGRFDESGSAYVQDLNGEALVVDVTGAAPVWLTGTTSGFPVEKGHSYIAVAPSAALKPRIEGVTASRLRTNLARADYIVIGPRALLPEATRLLELRGRQGLRTRAVPIEEVSSEFGFGEERPEAIREFLTYAFHNWRRPAPRYVLLLGDATYDFKDYLATGVRNEVPPVMIKTSYLWTASDPTFAQVNGDDLLPDLAIGRLPAANATEARIMIEKILEYESTGSVSRGAVTLVADDSDAAGDFEGHAEELSGGILNGRHPERIYLSRMTPARARSAIRDRLDRGTSLLAYIGHGGIHLWAHENVFDTSDVKALAPQSQQPLTLTLNCLNGYFHFPYFDSLGESLVKAEAKGAIAAFSPSGLSLDGPAHVFHKALLTELVSGRHPRLGDAVLAAQSVYASGGAFPELLQIYHLLGDPALTLR